MSHSCYKKKTYQDIRQMAEREPTSAIIRLTIDWFNLIYDLDMWRCASVRWLRYCAFHNI